MKIKYLLFLFLLLLPFEMFASFYPDGTVCTKENATLIDSGKSLTFPKKEGKYVLCVKEQGFYNPFKGVSITAQTPLNVCRHNTWGNTTVSDQYGKWTPGSRCRTGTQYFVNNTPVWGYLDASNYVIYDTYWGQYINTTTGQPNQLIFGEVVTSKVYWHDITSPYCDAPNTAIFHPSGSQGTSIVIPPNTWYSGSLAVEVKCKDDLSGCRTPSIYRQNVQHGTTEVQVTFEDNAGYANDRGNRASPSCKIPTVLIDKTPPLLVISDPTNPNLFIRNSPTDLTDPDSWLYFYASGVTFTLTGTDRYVAGEGISSVARMTANITPRGSLAQICSKTWDYSQPLDAVSRSESHIKSEKFECSSLTGIQKTGDYTLTVILRDYAGNEKKIIQPLRVVPNLNLVSTIRLISKSPLSAPYLYANGSDYYLYETKITDSFGNLIPNTPIMSVTQTGAKRISQDDRSAFVNAVRTPTVQALTSVSGFIQEKTKNTALNFTSTSSPYYRGNQCFRNFKNVGYDTVEKKYKYEKRTNSSIYFYADDNKSIYAGSICTGARKWTPQNPYTYTTTNVPQYTSTITPGSVTTNTLSVFNFSANALVGGEFSNIFDIRLRSWEKDGTPLSNTFISVQGGDNSAATFARLYSSMMRLGNNETSLKFGQKQSLIFTPQIDPSQVPYVTNPRFENAQSIRRSYTGYVVLGVTPDTGNPNTVYFTPELTAKLNISPRLEAYPRVSYTIGGANVSYPMGTSFVSFGSLLGSTGSINSIFIEGYQSSDGKDTITSNLVNIGNVSFSEISNQIRKTVALLTRNRQINDGTIVNGIKYISGDVTLSGDVSDWKTLVVIDGDVTFSANFNTAKKNLGIILLRDKNLTKGNIYILPNVGFIGATIYTDGSIMSTDMSGNVFTTSDKARSDTLSQQIVFYGALYSRNTIGGATRGGTTDTAAADYILPGGSKTQNLDEAVKYDLSFLRMGNVGYDDPLKTKNLNGGKSDSVVILRNRESLASPPPGFEK